MQTPEPQQRLSVLNLDSFIRSDGWLNLTDEKSQNMTLPRC